MGIERAVRIFVGIQQIRRIRIAVQNPPRLNWKPVSKIERYQVGASDFLKAKLRSNCAIIIANQGINSVLISVQCLKGNL